MVYIANIIHPHGNGYCIVSANSPKQVEDIIHAQSRYHGARIVDFKKLCWQDTDTHIIYEGAITTLGKNAYDIAVEHGFKGTVEEWLESLRGENGKDGKDGNQGPQGIEGPQGPKGDPMIIPYEDWSDLSKETIKNDIVRSLNIEFATTDDVDNMMWDTDSYFEFATEKS